MFIFSPQMRTFWGVGNPTLTSENKGKENFLRVPAPNQRLEEPSIKRVNNLQTFLDSCLVNYTSTVHVLFHASSIIKSLVFSCVQLLIYQSVSQAMLC